LIVILISLIFSAFFSGMEIAFVTSNKLRLELEKKQGSLNAKIVSILSHNPSHFIATMLVGNTISLVVYGIQMAYVLEPLIMQYIQSSAGVLIIQTILSTALILVTAEFIPKAVFRTIPNTLLNFMAAPVFIIYILLYPVVKMFTSLTFLLLRIFKVNVSRQNEQIAFTKMDLGNLLDETTQNDSVLKNNEIDRDIKIFQNALDFSEVKLRECIVPRTEIEAVEVDDPMDELKGKFIHTGFSKIIVYENSIDNIIGFVHLSALYKNPPSIKSVLIDVIYVPESMSAQKLLTKFIHDKKNLAVVVDEFGGTAGIVTIEDVIEEIFGEIEDEHDTQIYEEKKIAENEYSLSGRLEIDYLNEKFNISLPVSNEYETLAGFLLYYHGSIPLENEEITIKLEHTFIIKVLKVDNNKIDLLKLIINEA